MRKVLIVLLSSLLLVSCQPATVGGRVVSKFYNPPHTAHFDGTTTSVILTNGDTAWVNVPAHDVQFSEGWFLIIKQLKCDALTQIEVSVQEFSRVEVGEDYEFKTFFPCRE